MCLPLYHAGDYSRIETEEHPPSSDSMYCSKFRHDVMRLVHSPAFRRLQGKMHLFPVYESDFFRNRLTHSLEVAQIAKLIGLKLNTEQVTLAQTPLDLDLLEFAGLAHDLGHPPFGHAGELALNEMMKGKGGFEGNAQTLRILTVLEKKILRNDIHKDSRSIGVDCLGKDYRLGLNLTARSLATIFKYDKEIPLVQKNNVQVIKGYYNSERELVQNMKTLILNDSPRGHFKTVECQIMDLADDIANAIYDLEDTFKAGFINPLDLLSVPEKIKRSVARSVAKKLKVAFSITDVKKEIQQLFGSFFSSLNNSYSSASEENYLMIAATIYQRVQQTVQNSFFRTELSANLLDNFISGIQFEYNETSPALSRVYLDDATLRRVETLKYLTYYVVTLSPRIKVCEYRGTKIVREIFEALVGRNGMELLPSDIRELFHRVPSEEKCYRVVCDYIAGMTDSYANEFYARIKSDQTRTFFKPL